VDYLVRAFGAWFVGFFPLAEIYVAIPAAIATGLDSVSVIFWSVFGNYTPIMLINFGYEYLMRYEKIRNWFTRLVSEKAKARIDRYGVWFVLLLTPWTGVWVMAVTAKALRMESRRFLLASFVSIFVYAVVLTITIQTGVQLVNQ
jgi:uncharacterized membrane protein